MPPGQSNYFGIKVSKQGIPVQNASENENKMLERQGFNIVHWNASGMTFWAISDLNLSEMQEFAQAVQE